MVHDLLLGLAFAQKTLGLGVCSKSLRFTLALVNLSYVRPLSDSKKHEYQRHAEEHKVPVYPSIVR